MAPLGRGGAGNIEAAAVATSEKRLSHDLERNQTEAEDYAGRSHDGLHTNEYAHMGRGGAGNYYSPRELIHTGEFSGAGTSHVLGDGTPQPAGVQAQKTAAKAATATTGYRGRGGAGNYSYGVDESEERRYRAKHEEEEQKKEMLRQQVEKNVANGLPRPEKARLPGTSPVRTS